MRFKLALIGHSVLNIAGALIIWIGAIFLVLPLGVEPKTLFLLREATLPIPPQGHYYGGKPENRTLTVFTILLFSRQRPAQLT